MVPERKSSSASSLLFFSIFWFVVKKEETVTRALQTLLVLSMSKDSNFGVIPSSVHRGCFMIVKSDKGVGLVGHILRELILYFLASMRSEGRASNRTFSFVN